MRRVFAGCAIVGAVSSFSPAAADFINEPAASGLGAVNITGVSRNPTTGIYDISGPVFDASGRQLQIGYSSSIPGGVATLTLNNQVGTYDVIGITGLGITYVGNGSDGVLNIDGAGAFIEADTTWFGLGDANANVNITNGGRYSGERVFVGLDDASGAPQANVDVLVDGAGSRLETETVSIGSSSDAPTSGRSEVIISNGGTLSAAPTPGETYSYGQIYVGADSLSQNDFLRVTGAGSLAEATDYVGVGGLAGHDRLEVLDGGRVEAALGAPGGEFGSNTRAGIGAAPGANATLLVSGAGSTFDSGGDVSVGYGPRFVGWDGECCDTPIMEPYDGTAIIENGGLLRANGEVLVSNGGEGVNGVLTVRAGGVVEADRVVVNAGGVLNGDGGLIAGDLLVDGGTLAPGESPGTLFVDGDLDLLGALVRIEIGGLGEGEYDVLDVTGDVTADSTTEFVFSLIDGFKPTGDASFDFLRVAGMMSIADAMFSFEGFEGLTSSFSSDGSGFRLDVSGSVAAVPLPASGLLLVAGLGLLGAHKRRARKAA